MRRALLAALLIFPWADAGGAATLQPGVGQPALNAALGQAAERGDVAGVRNLLKRGASPRARRADGRTALTSAALGNHVAVARMLVAAGADPDPQDTARNNALLVTGETGNVGMLREVLRAGPDLTRTNRFGGTALIPAADRGHVEYVRELLKTGIDVNHVNNLGWTALLEAVLLGDGDPRHTEIVRLLLAADANPNLTDRDGVTPLAHAKRRGFASMVALLTSGRGR
ncbi:ankyrin repeat domain-containing protein [Deinococcus hopiensis]|uniref:Uncharacterized protein n=1 Tax=Deinococcus hopiensis KR-140 TaxID=695939 RepID=A0A1W1UUG1_9DEIO|nr:ankyrin repeat domain-containing protein [Deinococcus hopiensis]SMB84354.1 hypothetical protein SAMN00790413_05098 [Deinococcus hopiensis KR-140]